MGFPKGEINHYCSTFNIHDWCSLLNKHCDIACVFFDFKKAFDSVPHQKMMEKLSQLDLPPSILSWLCSYLSGKRQFVLVNGEHSKSTLFRSGVPQGSVLGPLVFLLYINDITKLHFSDQSRLTLYADNMLLYKSITRNTSQVEIQQDINRLFQWSQENMLSFNITKCKCMLLIKKRNTYFVTIFLNNQPLEYVCHYNEHLGVILASNLSCSNHIQEICKKTTRVLGMIYHRISKNINDPSTLLKLYTALVRPHLEYAAQVWNPYQEKDIHLFQSFVYSSDFTFICLTETWLSENVSDGEILPNGFVFYRKDRPTRGGGVLIAVKSAVPSSSLPSPTDIEVISVEVGINHDLVLCSIYVPPDSPVSLISSLVLYLSSLVSSYNRCIFVGDFNFPDISWSSLLGSSMSSNVFCEFIFDCNLTQHVTQPTHKKGNILDLVFTSSSVNIKHLSVNPQLLSEFSDHFIISFDVSFSPSANISKSLCVFDFSKTNFTDICSFLLDFDFSVCFHSRDIEFIWSTIKSVIFVAISLFVPKKISKRINEPKWFNSGIRHHHNCLHTMKKKYKRHPTPNCKV